MIEEQEEEDEEEEEHKCSACHGDFNPDQYGYLVIDKCPIFVGEKMNLRAKNGLQSLCISNFPTAKLADLKLPDCLEHMTILNFQGKDLTDLKLPDGLIRMWLNGLPNANLADLKLPRELKQLWLDNLPNANLTDLKLPDEFSRLMCYNIKKGNVPEMLVANGYYDENCLQTVEEVYQKPIVCHFGKNCHELKNIHTYKKRCINLNWLFEQIYGWDWNLNIVIDNYCGFTVQTCHN